MRQLHYFISILILLLDRGVDPKAVKTTNPAQNRRFSVAVSKSDNVKDVPKKDLSTKTPDFFGSVISLTDEDEL